MIFNDKTLHSPAKNATLKEQGAACCKHGDPSKARATFHGGHDMPFEHDIGDSAPKNKSEQTSNWKSIAELARALAEKAAGK